MKYRVGDKVLMKSGDGASINHRYGIAGQVGTIRMVDEVGGYYHIWPYCVAVTDRLIERKVG